MCVIELFTCLDRQTTMPLPNNKAELLDRFDSACIRLLAEIASMPPEMARLPVFDGGVSLCDLIS